MSVIVPCHDEGKLVAEAVWSVQEPEPVELVVIDDGSTDPVTQDVLADLAGAGVRVVSHIRNQGLAAARMTGLRATSAAYVFPLDGDDLAVAGALAVMAALLDGEPEASLCLADFSLFGKDEIDRSTPAWLDPFRIAYRNDFPVGSMLFRRSALEGAGGWRDVLPGVAGYEDWDLLMTLAERGARSIHAGPGVRSLHHRRGAPSMLAASRKRHRPLYRQLRRTHPHLFSRIRAYRRASDLSTPMKLLYPIVFGARPRLAIEPRLRAWLGR